MNIVCVFILDIHTIIIGERRLLKNFHIFKLIILFFLCYSTNLSSELIYSNSTYSKKKNIPIKMIKGWQTLSFKSSLLNCQFHPCCSNYCIESIERFGTIKGILLGADRISRCHPFAEEFYKKNEKGLVDPVPNYLSLQPKDSNDYSIPVSFIIPGLDKILNGRVSDGIIMFIITELSLYRTITSFENGNLLFIPYATIFVIFYSSNIFRFINL